VEAVQFSGTVTPSDNVFHQFQIEDTAKILGCVKLTAGVTMITLNMPGRMFEAEGKGVWPLHKTYPSREVRQTA